MAEWLEGTIGDLLTLQRGIDLPEQQRTAGTVPIMGSFGVTGFHNRAACKGPGVTVGRSGASIGTVNYVVQDYWPLNTCLYVKDFKGNDPRFCYYFLRARDLAHLNSGSAQPSLNRNFVHPVPASIPPRSQQRAIAAILGSLDDKIDLNLQMNQTMEAMARAIFKDWFVDFGPTRAKVEGRAPYLDSNLWAIFPDRLTEETSLPEGWANFLLDMLVNQHTASVVPSSTPGEIFEHFSLPAYDAGQTPSLDRGDTIKSNKTLIPDSSVLLSKLNPEIERVWVPEPATVRRQVCSTEFLVFTPKANLNRSMLYALFTAPSFRALLLTMVTGTSKSHQRISPPALLKREVLVGSATAFDRFAEIVDPLVVRILANRAEVQSLAQTRDLLLPMLMSGEIRVRDAEKMAEAVA